MDEFLPSLLVNVEWSSSNYAQLGNTLKPKKLQDAPSITLAYPESSPESHSSSFLNTTYIITITDPDAPSRDDPKWSEFCHWIATGLPISQKRPQPLYASSNNNNNNDNTLELTSNLEEVMPYYPPGPPEKTGKHRYVFLIFIPENGTTEPLELSKPGDRRHWGYDYEGERVGVRKWSEENGLVPVGKFFFLSSLVVFLQYYKFLLSFPI